MSDTLGRLAIVLAAAWTVFCLAYVGYRAVNNPMDDRYVALETKLNAVPFVPEEFESPEEIDDRELRDRVMAKNALWSDLVAPPPPPPKPEEKGPDLDELVKGIRPSAREQIRNAQGLMVKVYTEGDRNGKFLGVGDRVNGLTILEITDDEVVFQAVVKKQEYSVPVKRR